MTKLDPIIAVQNVNNSSVWYQSIFGCKSKHGGDEFDILTSENGEVLICLHKWGEHDHPTMQDSKTTTGNGLILYFRADKMPEIRLNVEKLKLPIEEEVHLNPNSKKKEFALRDPDGYYLIISEFHNYGE